MMQMMRTAGVQKTTSNVGCVLKIVMSNYGFESLIFEAKSCLSDASFVSLSQLSSL